MVERSPKLPFLQEWAQQNPDAFSVYEGRHPQSYRAAIHSEAQLLVDYAQSNDVHAKEIKPVVFRVGAHLNDVVKTGKNIGTSVDISAEEAHRMLQEAATKASAIVTKGQHAKAVATGAARKIKLPKVPSKPPLQDAFVPYLHKSFDKRVNKLLQDKSHSTVDKEMLKAVALLVHGAYIDEQLKKEKIGSYISGFTEAPNKNFLRTMVKVDADYADEKNPHAHLLDVVRRSANTGALGEQEVFIATLDKLKDGKIKKFQIIRSKDEAMTDQKADVKFVIVNMAYTPTKIGRFSTFGDIVNDPNFDAMIDRIAKSEEIDANTMDCVVQLLGDRKLKEKVCTMVVEFQLYLHQFLNTKKRLHGIYKFQRAQNLTDLVRDLVKHATHPSMAYVADANEYNYAFIARARRELRKLGLRNDELKLSGKLPDEIDIDSFMQQVAAAGVRSLNLYNTQLGDAAGKEIAKALATNSTLEKLHLWGNKLGNEAGKEIGKSLATTSSLTYLKLNNNKLGDAGGKEIGKALATNSTLAYLGLYKTKLGDEAGKEIGKALATNSSLKELE